MVGDELPADDEAIPRFAVITGHVITAAWRPDTHGMILIFRRETHNAN